MEVDFVRAYDPAVDREAMKNAGVWEQFLEQRDIKLVQYREEDESGEPLPGPMIFKFRTLSRSERRQLDGQLPERKREHAFKLGVMSVRNAVYPGKERRDWSRKDPSKPMRDMDLDLFAERDVQHVGEAVMAFSFCSPDTQPYVPLLATCLDALIAAGLESQRRRAEATRRQAALPVDAPKSEQSAPPSTTPSDSA